MIKEQLKEAKIINDKIEIINKDIDKFNSIRHVTRVSISTINSGSGALEKSDVTINMDINKKFVKNRYANGICDDLIILEAEIITNGYINSIVRLLKEQLFIFERQFKQI
jgi:hypothetical protein